MSFYDSSFFVTLSIVPRKAPCHSHDIDADADAGFQVTVPGYAPLITQIYDKNSKYVDNDSVFAVKNDLLVDFKPLENNSGAKLELVYDVRLAPIQT